VIDWWDFEDDDAFDPSSGVGFSHVRCSSCRLCAGQRGSPAGSKGYKYTDPSGATCKKLRVTIWHGHDYKTNLLAFLLMFFFLPDTARSATTKNAITPPLREVFSCRPILGVACYRLGYAFASTITWVFVPLLATHLLPLKTAQIGALISLNVLVSTVFQSLPDVWAIEQVFPIIPVHRHNEAPTRRAILADITCDSDGKIDKFIESSGLTRTLPVHTWVESQEYYFGVFLVGAYQETLGDLHNLMGDTNVASVRVHGDGSFEFVREMSGDSISDVLSYVEYQPQQLLEQFRKTAEQAVRKERITLAQRQEILESFAASLRGYTYYED
jgi:hypothetical protein